MTKKEVMLKIKEMLSKDSTLYGAEIEVTFIDKKSNKIIKEMIKIEEK